MRHYANLWDTPFFMMWILLNEDGPYILGWFLILSGKWYTKRVMTVPKIQYLVKWSLSQRKVNVFCKVASYWQNICAYRLKRSPIKSSSFTWPKVKRIIENSTCAKEEKIINCKEWGKREESPKWLIFFCSMRQLYSFTNSRGYKSHSWPLHLHFPDKERVVGTGEIK